MQSFFSYTAQTRCGIPYIELLGQKSDWEKLHEKTEKVLTTFGLVWWLEHLRPILKQFCDAAVGRVDRLFWLNIAHKNVPQRGIMKSGDTPNMTGWLCAFFPIENEVKDIIDIAKIPAHISLAPITLRDAFGALVLETVIAGGVVVLTQDRETLALEPKTSWAIVAKESLDNKLGRTL